METEFQVCTYQDSDTGEIRRPLADIEDASWDDLELNLDAGEE